MKLPFLLEAVIMCNQLKFLLSAATPGSKETKKHMASNLATVAVVPMTPDVPLSMFTSVLCSTVNSIGKSETPPPTIFES